MTKIKITQVKSGIDRPERQKLTLRALGLRKLNASREVEATAQILGMVRKVTHLIRVEEVEGGIEATSTQEEVAEVPVAPVVSSAPVVADVPETAEPEAAAEAV